jgi:hypothetical protein
MSDLNTDVHRVEQGHRKVCAQSPTGKLTQVRARWKRGVLTAPPVALENKLTPPVRLDNDFTQPCAPWWWKPTGYVWTHEDYMDMAREVEGL